MSLPNAQIVARAPITTGTLGTPGSGLSGPEQFDAYMALARERIDLLKKVRVVTVKAQSGSIPRFTFATGNLRAATEAVGPAVKAAPTHSQVAYALTKTIWAAEVSNDINKFAVNGGAYFDQMTADAAEAWFLDLLRLATLGDPASLDASLNINTGWLTTIAASGNLLNGAAINGGNFTTTHLARAKRLLPERHKANSQNFNWIMSGEKLDELTEVISNRATGEGDKVLTMGADGSVLLYGRPVTIFGSLGNDVLYTDPRNLILVADSQNWSMVSEAGGEFRLRDVIALAGFTWLDAIVGDVTACVHIQNLN